MRESVAPFRAGFRRSELSLVARETRPMEAAFLAGPHDVALPFLDYLRPLVGDLPRAARLSDLPVARR